MAIEAWIDELVAVAGSVASHKGGYVKAYRVFERAEIPEDLSDFPCAITYGQIVHPDYSDSAPCVDLWEGTSEFHLFPDNKMSNIPEVLRYFGKIRNAFALKRTLGGLVSHLAIRAEGIVLVEAKYGVGNDHHALMVYWEVKEIVTSEITLGQ